MLNRLEIRTCDFTYTVAESNISSVSRLVDFVIDGEPLGKMLNVWPDRPWFGQTDFDQPKEIVDLYVEELLGLRTPRNQFGSGRLRLYMCSCGCDYCGIVSCNVRREGDVIHWEDISWENDDDDEHTRYRKLVALAFDYEQYSAAIAEFFAGV